MHELRDARCGMLVKSIADCAANGLVIVVPPDKCVNIVTNHDGNLYCQNIDGVVSVSNAGWCYGDRDCYKILT